ncbi:hypothetical protein KDL29_02735 [bacterium]|nr:hypothetical protein [bacterium]UNM08848.1 MAG: hypothetical protein H7A35_02085 [Planctomycetales bacterium]
MNLRLTPIITGIICSAVLLASCGGGRDSMGLTGAGKQDLPLAEPAVPDAVLDRFALYLNDGSRLGDATIEGLQLDLSDTEEGSTLRITADNVESLRAMYFSLEYDSRSFSPVRADASAVLPGEALELPLLAQPGELHYGRVLVDPLAQAGFSGSGVLAEISFARHAFDPADNSQPQARLVSVAPPAQSFELVSTDEPGMNYSLMIPYQLPGDYDQNSQVNLADLTPLAVHFGKKAPFDIGSVETVVDGDANGEINIADISVIGANFQNTFTGLSAMAGDQAALDGGTGTSIQQFAFADAEGVSSEDRLWFSTAFDIDSIAGAPLGWTLLSGSNGGSPVVDKPSDPIAFETEGQRVMSLNAQLFPLQPATAEAVSIYVNALDADAAITEVLVDFGDGSEPVLQPLALDGNYRVTSLQHAYDTAGDYTANLSFRSGPAAEPRAAKLVKSVFNRSFTVSVHAPFSDAPEVGITAEPVTSAPLGTQVAFSAGLLNPGGGSSIDNYEWDFNGDGVFDEEGSASATVFDAAAADVDLGHVTVRATSDTGEQASATLAYAYNTTGSSTPQAELLYDGALQFSETNVQLGGLGGVVNGFGDKLGALNADFGNFRSQFRVKDPAGIESFIAYVPGTEQDIQLDGLGDFRIDFEVLFAGALFCSDGITVTLGARAIDLDVFPTETTIKAPISFTADPAEPGLIDHFVFDFGDGNQVNTSDTTVWHEYQVKQDYDATVTAYWTDDKQNTSAPVTVSCGFERQVDLLVDTSPGLVNVELNFTADVEFPELVTEYIYEFGDGNAVTTTDTSVPHTYVTVGNYEPFLIASYSDGPTILSDKLNLDVQDPGQLVTEPLLEIVSQQNDFPLLVEFTAKNTKFKVGTSLLSFSINFGDGSSVQNITDINQSVYHAYYTPGSFTVTLTLRDTDFEQNTDDLNLDVTDPGGKFQYSAIGTTANTFEVAKIAVVKGNAGQVAWSARAAGGSDGFAVKNGVNDLYHVNFAATANAEGTAWNTPVKVAEAKGAQDHLSAASMSGVPAVAYYLYSSIDNPFPDDGDLLYCTSTQLDGSAWNTPVVVSSTGDIGRHPTLLSVNGRPAIASRLSTSATDGTGQYIRATAGDGSTWGGFQDLGPSGNEDYFSLLLVFNGVDVVPAVGMQLNTGGQFRLGFQAAQDQNGATWVGGDTVLFGSNDRAFGVDTMTADEPWIAFQDSIAGRIYFSKGTDAAGSSFTTESVVIDAPDGSFPASFSLGLSANRPAVLVSVKGGTDGAPEPVYVVTASDNDGATWGAPELVGWTWQHHAVAFTENEDGEQLILFYDHMNAIGGTGLIRSGSRNVPAP